MIYSWFSRELWSHISQLKSVKKSNWGERESEMVGGLVGGGKQQVRLCVGGWGGYSTWKNNY